MGQQEARGDRLLREKKGEGNLLASRTKDIENKQENAKLLSSHDTNGRKYLIPGHQRGSKRGGE